MAGIVVCARNINWLGSTGVLFGDAISTRATIGEFTRREVMPRVVRVSVPGALLSDVDFLLDEWRQEIQLVESSFDILSSTYTIGASVLNTSVLENGVDFGRLQLYQLEHILSGWGVRSISGLNGVYQFDISVMDIVRSSKAYDWPEKEVNLTSISEVSYSQESGTHRILVDYSSTSRSPTSVERQAMSHSRVISNDGGKIVFDISSMVVIESFLNSLKVKFDQINKLMERRFGFSKSFMESAEKAGGHAEIAKGDIANNIVDRAA